MMSRKEFMGSVVHSSIVPVILDGLAISPRIVMPDLRSLPRTLIRGHPGLSKTLDSGWSLPRT